MPADLAPPPQPAALLVQRSGEPGQFPPQPPVAVCPPRSEPSESCEGVAQADWGDQVAAGEQSGELQGQRPIVPEWANMETPPVPEVPPLRASPATASSGEAVATSDVPRPGLTYQVLLDAIRPSWFEGTPAHTSVVDSLLARYSSEFSRPGLISSLEWMLLQRQDVGMYLGWWIGERQASHESPADTLRALREILSRMHHAPVE